jgi:hypothetical protein
LWFATYTALVGREVQLNVSDSVTKKTRCEEAADFREALLRAHAVRRKGIGRSASGRQMAIDGAQHSATATMAAAYRRWFWGGGPACQVARRPTMR